MIIDNFKGGIKALQNFIKTHEKDASKIDPTDLYPLLANVMFGVLFQFAHLEDGTPAENLEIVKEFLENATRNYKTLAELKKVVH